jgi:hypothetical protein
VISSSSRTANPFAALLGELDVEPELSKAEFAARHFLNPQVPQAVRDDPDGSWHYGLQVTDDRGEPLKNLRKDDPIPLALRWYQKDMINDPSRFRVYRCGRRIGKSFVQGCEAVVEALTNPNAKILVLAPNESHVKVLFDEYVRPLLSTYRHNKSGRIGIPRDMSGRVPTDCDFVISRDTQKPQEIVITDGKNHNVTIRGMVISNAARGQSANLLVFDEADYADTEAVRGIVAPIIMTRPDTKVVMSSTPTGRRDSFYYEKCHDSKWSEHHHTFEVLPHYDEDLHNEMATLAGGASTNTFLQEYLAEFGSEMAGVFDAAALNRAFYIAPYCGVLEDVNMRTRERRALLASDRTNTATREKANYEAVEPVDWPVKPHDRLGAESLYRPEYRGHGVVTVGTDWNDTAGMQTVAVWWPPEEWLRDGRIKVARFNYRGAEPITTSRSKDAQGQVKTYSVGQTNGTPGNPHDLSNIKGIVIWHGRLEAGGGWSWSAAANRVAGMLSIPDFVDTWYVDYGYGTQVNQTIEKIMVSGQYETDPGGLLEKAKDIPDRLLKQIRLFHPDEDPERTGKKYQTVRFGDVYQNRDIDYTKRDDRYKDVLVNVSKRMIAGHEILIPYGEFTGYHEEASLGNHYVEEVQEGQVVETAVPERDRDVIEPTGADPARGERSFGGLVTQMRAWRVDGVSPTGRPRYAGPDHAIDALMLALLAWHENYSEEVDGNIFRKVAHLETATADDLFDGADEATRATNRQGLASTSTSAGDFSMRNYQNDRAPLDAMTSGRVQPEEVGTSMSTMLSQAAKHFSRRG